MNKPASLNNLQKNATKSRGCQAKGCPNLGSARFTIVDKVKRTYFMCDEHVRVLSDSQKKYIARTEGTRC